MKPNKFKPRITITCDIPITNFELSKLKRVKDMLEFNDMEVVLKNIKIEEHERLLAIPA